MEQNALSALLQQPGAVKTVKKAVSSPENDGGRQMERRKASEESCLGYVVCEERSHRVIRRLKDFVRPHLTAEIFLRPNAHALLVLVVLSNDELVVSSGSVSATWG